MLKAAWVVCRVQGALAGLVVHDAQPQTSLNGIELLVIADRLSHKRTTHRRPLVPMRHDDAWPPCSSSKSWIQQHGVGVELREFRVLGMSLLRGNPHKKNRCQGRKGKAGDEFRHDRSRC